jgi:hypothetical protein
MGNLKCIKCVANIQKVFSSNLRPAVLTDFSMLPFLHVNIFPGAAIVALSDNKELLPDKIL